MRASAASDIVRRGGLTVHLARRASAPARDADNEVAVTISAVNERSALKSNKKECQAKNSKSVCLVYLTN